MVRARETGVLSGPSRWQVDGLPECPQSILESGRKGESRDGLLNPEHFRRERCIVFLRELCFRMSTEFNPSLLASWLRRSHPLPPFKSIETSSPNLELGGFLGLTRMLKLHESADLPAISLRDSWQLHRNYVEQSLILINSDEPGWVDREEAELIEAELGPPPGACTPIYLITVRRNRSERVVYVGRTSASSRRFYGGHAAFLKLHYPRYRSFSKHLYLGCVMLLTDDDYLPLEWIQPLSRALSILLDVEAQLIFEFKPELNSTQKRHYRAKLPITLHIQNFTGESDFLNDCFVFPR